MGAVNEGSTATLVLTFKDEDEVAVTPTSASYRIDDVSSGDSILAETAISPSSSTYDLEITKEQNAILNSARQTEVHEVTVEFLYSGTKAGTNSYELSVVNKRFVPLS